MLSESVVRREEPPSFLLFPLERRSRHFSKKGKERKDGSIEIRHHGWRRFQSAEERKKEKSERKESSCLPGSRPWEKSEEKRRESPFFGAVLPFCRKRGTPPDAGSGREEKGNLLQRTGENLLSPLFLKKEKKKALSLCSLPFSAAVRHHAIARKKKKHHSNYGQKKKKKREAPSFPCRPSFFVCSLFCTLLKEGKRHHIDMQDAAKDARMRKRKKEGRRLQRGRDRNRGCTSPISGSTTAVRRNSNTSPDTGTIRGRTGTS